MASRSFTRTIALVGRPTVCSGPAATGNVGRSVYSTAQHPTQLGSAEALRSRRAVRTVASFLRVDCSSDASDDAFRRRWARRRGPTRPFSSGSADGTDETLGNPVEIPPPTWSVADLRLTPGEKEEPASVSDEELHRLARRCHIDVRILPPSDRERLKVELAGMMRCISVVCDNSSSSVSSSSPQAEGRGFTAEDLYDLPRRRGGFPDGMPVRDDGAGGRHESAWEESGEKEDARGVVDSVRGTKMVERNGEHYFAVVTGRGSGEGSSPDG